MKELSVNRHSDRQSERQTQYAGSDLLRTAEEELGNYHNWIVDKFLHALRGARIERVLDFGPGTGVLSEVFRRRTGIVPEGVELDPDLRATFLDRGFQAYSSIEGAPTNYDLIFSSNVLEHIEDDVATLEHLRGHLKPGGYLLLYLPAFKLLWTSLDDNVGHYRRYTAPGITSRLRTAGFEVDRVRYCDSVGFFLSLLFKLVPTESGAPSRLSLRIYDKALLPLSRFLDLFLHRWIGKNVFVVARRSE